MKEYHKIQTVWLRDPQNKHKTLIEGAWARPEFEYLKDLEWEFTEKVDGTNIRVRWDVERRFKFGGRTDNAQIPTFLFDRLQVLFGAQQAGASIFADNKEVTLYGEGYGGRIQKAGVNYKGTADFVLFDVMVGSVWLSRANVLDVAEQLNIWVVPPVGKGSLDDAISQVRAGPKSQWGDFTMEGYVCKPSVELADRMGRRIVAKIKVKDFS